MHVASSVQRNHPLVPIDGFGTVEEYVLHLIHLKAYEHASTICNGRNVLDWGCNNGYGLPVLAKTARRIGGVDSNPLCVQKARLLHPEYANDIWLYDGQHVPVPDQDWDVVVSFQVIEHVKEVDLYLEAILSVMKDSGTALFTSPNREIRLDQGMKPWNEFHVTEFSAVDLAMVLRKHFRHVQVYGMQGDQEIIEIERSRCAHARSAARSKKAAPLQGPHRFRWVMNRTVRSILPPHVLAHLRHRYRRTTIEQTGQGLPTAVIEHFSTSQLRYTERDVSSAVDLLAVCSNKEIE